MYVQCNAWMPSEVCNAAEMSSFNEQYAIAPNSVDIHSLVMKHQTLLKYNPHLNTIEDVKHYAESHHHDTLLLAQDRAQGRQEEHT